MRIDTSRTSIRAGAPVVGAGRALVLAQIDGQNNVGQGRARGREHRKPLLAEFLKREVGSWDPEAIDEFLCDRGSKHEAKINAWGEAFYAQIDAMWERARAHVRERHRIEIEPG